MFRSLLWAAGGTGFIFTMSVLGAATVFLFSDNILPRTRTALLGFAAGVMLAASVWSLFIPAMEMAAEQTSLPCWLPAVSGAAAGCAFLAVFDMLLRRRSSLVRSQHDSDVLLVSALTLHNIPEGMAVGLAFALASGREAFAAAAALALGIGIQNFPEGAAVSLPLRQSGLSRSRSFLAGVASGFVEPLFGLLAVLAASVVRPLMPWLMSFAAGAMLYVSSDELIPDARGFAGSAGLMVGFLLMMTLDVALG